MSEPYRCKWPTGTAWTGPQQCGRPGKAWLEVTRDIFTWFEGRLVPVCGIHRRVGLRFPRSDNPAFREFRDENDENEEGQET